MLRRWVSFSSFKVSGQVFLGVAFLLPLALTASTLQDETMSSAANGAVWIGRIHIEALKTLTTSGFPVSQVQAKVVEVLKGSGEGGQSLAFEIPGGKDGRVNRRVLGFPTFKEDQDYIVFLDRDPREGAIALSLDGAQMSTWSAYRVVENAGTAMVVRSGESTLRNESAQGFQLMHDRGVKSYEAFVDELYRSLN